MSKLTPSQSEVRASLRGRLEDVIEELEAVRGVMRDELALSGSLDILLFNATHPILQVKDSLS